jgi:hypothetical protein
MHRPMPTIVSGTEALRARGQLRQPRGGAYVRFAVLQFLFLVLFFFVVRFSAEVSEANMALKTTSETSLLESHRWPGAPGEAPYTADLLLRTRLGGTLHGATSAETCSVALPMLALSGVGATTRMMHNVLEFAQDPFVRIYTAARNERDARAIFAAFHALPATLYGAERQRELVVTRVHFTTSDQDRLRLILAQAVRDSVRNLLFISPTCFFKDTWRAATLPHEHPGMVWMPLNITGRVPASAAVSRLRAGLLLSDAHHGSDVLLTCDSSFLQSH